MSKIKKKTVIWIISSLVVLIIASFVVFPVIIMNSMLNKHIHFNRTWSAEAYGIQAEHFFVKTEDGLNISAYEVAVDTPKAVIVCLSGIEKPSSTMYFGHARFFKEHDIATIMFDMRAHGESDGDKICVGYKEYLDTKAIVNYIKVKPMYTNVPIIILGTSMGGSVAINSIGEIPEIDGIISLSAFASWEDLFYDYMLNSIPKIFADIERPFISLASFIKFGRNSFTIKPIIAIEKLNNRPILMMHSKDDSQIPYVNFERLLKHAPSNLETYIIAGNKHFITDSFMNPGNDTEYSDKMIQFINKNFIEMR